MKAVLSRRAVLAAACASVAPFASAQAYPSHPVRLVVGFSAGGGVDAMARLLASKLSGELGQQFVVENRTGASGLIAGDVVAKSPPDGYTLLVAESSMLIAPHLGIKMAFDPVKGFTPVAALFAVPLLIVANNAFPANNPKELVSVLKANPGKYSYASPGVGTVHHLAFEMIKARTGAFVVHIPYRGAAQIVPDVVGGQVPLAVVSTAAGMAQARAGKLKAIALLSSSPVPGAEGVPLMSEALPGFNATPTLYLMAPPGTPQPVVERLVAAVRTALASPEVKQGAALQGAAPAFASGAQLAQELERESADWGAIIRSQHISAK